MTKTDKITELIEKYRKELIWHYEESGRLEANRNSFIEKFSYSEGNNDAFIVAKENFLEELEELKEHYSYE